MVEVRAIGADELEAWVGVTHVAFHGTHSAADEARIRRERLAQPTPRTLGAFDDGRLVGTVDTFVTQLTVPGLGTITADAITSASVLPTHRRRGLLRQLLLTDLRAAHERGELASILVAAEYPIYGRFGYGPATQGAVYTLQTASARLRPSAAAVDGRIELVEGQEIRRVAPEVFESIRTSHPGQIGRDDWRWDVRAGLSPSPWGGERASRFAVYRGRDGRAEGYAVYRIDPVWEARVPRGTLLLDELMALTPAAYTGLWQYCASVDLISTVRAVMRRPDEPLYWLVDNARASMRLEEISDFLWLRLLDTAACLGCRSYATPGQVVLEVHDPLELSGGRFLLEGGPDGARATTTQRSADLSIGMDALGAAFLGGPSLRVLHEAGRMDEHTPGAVEQAARMFGATRAPWCSTFF